MTASQAPLPPVPLPIRPRPRRGETTESYARRLARANHLRPSYPRAFLCDPPRRTGAIRPRRLAAISGRSVRALEHALADLTQGSPPGRQPRAPGSVRTLISTWLRTEPELTPAQIWQRLHDEHDAGISYSTIGHYRRSIINSHYRLNAASRAGSDDSNQPQSQTTATFTRTSHASPIASQTGPARSEPQSPADLYGTGQSPAVFPGVCAGDGARHREPLAACAAERFEEAVPVRSFPWAKGAAHFPGSWWSSTTSAHVGFDSWLERDHVMLMDFDPAITGIASQPFW